MWLGRSLVQVGWHFGRSSSDGGHHGTRTDSGRLGQDCDSPELVAKPLSNMALGRNPIKPAINGCAVAMKHRDFMGLPPYKWRFSLENDLYMGNFPSQCLIFTLGILCRVLLPHMIMCIVSMYVAFATKNSLMFQWFSMVWIVCC